MRGEIHPRIRIHPGVQKRSSVLRLLGAIHGPEPPIGHQALVQASQTPKKIHPLQRAALFHLARLQNAVSAPIRQIAQARKTEPQKNGKPEHNFPDLESPPGREPGLLEAKGLHGIFDRKHQRSKLPQG